MKTATTRHFVVGFYESSFIDTALSNEDTMTKQRRDKSCRHDDVNF